MKIAQKDRRPRVLIIASRKFPSADSPSYKVFSMRCHNGVAIKPSNVTMESMTRTNTTSDGVTFFVSNNPVPGGRKIHLRQDSGASWSQLQSTRCSRSLIVTPPFAADTSLGCRSTRISVGANLARTLNASANGSPCRSQVLRPNKYIPIQVRTENPMASRASCDGIDRPSQTNSTQAKTINSAVAGQTPRCFGQPILAPRQADWIGRVCSYHSNSAAHGLMTHHTLPIRADR